MGLPNVGSNLQQANLKEANLQKTDLRDSNLQKTNLRNANLRETQLYGAKNLTFKQIKLACNWEKAIYKAKWNEEKQFWAIEPDNTKFIEELKNDRESDPKEPPDCSIWENPK